MRYEGSRVIATLLACDPPEFFFTEVVPEVGRQTRPPDSVVVVDNGSAVAVSDRLDAGMTVLRLEENLGVGAGHNAGWEWAIGQGADFIWALEHDAIPARNCLDVLLSALAQEEASGRGKIGAVIPIQRPLEERSGGCRGEENEPVDRRSESPWLTFNGSLISAPALREVGALLPELFVGHEDREFATRLRQRRYMITKVHGGVVYHQNKGGESGWSLRKQYYSRRNEAYLRWREKNAIWRFTLGVSYEWARVLGAMLRPRRYRHSIRGTMVRLLAAVDGVLPRMGTRCPKIARADVSRASERGESEWQGRENAG